MRTHACFVMTIVAIAVATLLPAHPAASSESLQSGDYTVVVDGRGKLVIKRDRVATGSTPGETSKSRSSARVPTVPGWRSPTPASMA